MRPSKSMRESQSPPKEVLTIEKVLDMFHSPYTKELTDRKADTIIRFCRQRTEGFLLEEINQLISILELSIAENDSLMHPAIEKICETASKPFVKLRTSD